MNIINPDQVEIPQWVHNTIVAMAGYGYVFSKVIVEHPELEPPSRYAGVPVGAGVHIAYFAVGNKSYKVTGFR